LRSECLLHVKKVQQAAIYTNQSSKKPWVLRTVGSPCFVTLMPFGV
jgi:hypothetical protein